MKPTISFVTQKFREFNELCFANELPLPPIVLSRSRRTLGMVSFRRQRLIDGTYRFSDFTFKISNLIDRDERVVEDTILHEMIHYYIMWKQLQDTSAHGQLFQRMMNGINRRYGRHISITHRSTSVEKDADTQRRHHLVCLIEFGDGKMGVMVVPHTRIFTLWDAPRRFGPEIKYRWYSTVDPFFNRYPRSLTAKAYRITSVEASEHLKHGVILENTGKSIRPMRK